jgi:uncharacterized protein YodC (DUF2158 family)
VADEISAGIVVQLKSGGPDMTVNFVNDVMQTAECSWFEGKKRHTETFTLASLKVVPPSE